MSDKTLRSPTHTLSRRETLVGALGGVAALGATQLGASGAAFAKTPMSGPARGDFRRVKLGKFEVTTVFDGFGNVPRVFPIFGENQSEEVVAAHMKANNLPGDKMQIGFTPVIVNTGSELVLFDTGNGAGRGETRGKLLMSLEKAGFTPDMIDVVVITHFHPDHIGGLVTEGEPTFTNARYVMGEAEHNFWTSDTVMTSSNEAMQGRAKVVKENVLPVADKATFIKPGQDAVSGLTAIDASGHTPGQLAFNIESEGQRLLLWADTCNHYVASLQKPEWHVVFDMDKDTAIASRKKILDMAAADKIAATGYHMPFPAIGYVEKVGDMHRWVPHSYQLDL